MRELTAIEIDAVSGAGWLQDGFASLGSKAGSAVWSLGSALSIDLPIIGTVNLSTIAPGLGEQIGKTIGSTIGGAIEGTLASVPVIGGLLNRLLGN
ncbi:hypothetical protein [Klebsiella oxytoca]|uniref:Uncharacterized protein n=1 Tax=Klebsiella oxytoca TaxID=571 RepID=A0A6B8N0D2_KLEOX|nr:hypothetical protein [Klebsiella oxytoca]QGN40429.1 hypothetical protein GJ746_02335 [Klebsiella oxytoca]